MKLRIPLLLAFIGVGAFAADRPAHSKPVLEKGMTADAIVQAVGKPDRIQPLQTSDGKAEKWIYRRKTGQTVSQTANTQGFIPAMTGVDGGGVKVGTALVPTYRLKYISDYQVTALLMVNDQLQLGKQWTESDERFAD